jgi:4-amino-4-deoxy-L-arabinose transferase-like glycosyltransferase
VTRGKAYALVACACALPRLAVLVHERAAILAHIEKSDIIARQYLASGTFGYVPGEPSAYTQPMYGWFLIAVYWLAGRHWWSLGSAQILIAVATAIVVYEIGRRFLSPRAGLVAALAATLQPYLVWHDVHGNREILDQLLGAAVFGLALAVARAAGAAALGAACGLGILSNTRLVLLPVALAVFLLWRRATLAAAALVLVAAAVVLAPWVIRNRVEVGCFAITTDARALWKANNLGTYAVLARGGWIDAVPDIPQRRGHVADAWRTPQEAGDIYSSSGRKLEIDECAQQSHYEHLVVRFWERHPGAKARLIGQASEMLWSPALGQENETSSAVARNVIEPLYVVPLYVLAIAGLFVVPAPVRVLALVFAAYETLAACVFAGTTRYRVPWDFVLALLAAAAIERLLARARPPLRSASQNR